MTIATARCDECHVGLCRPTPAPFLLSLDGRVMVVPDAPAYLCDVCGDIYYDEEFTGKVQYLLERLADGAARHGKTTRPSYIEKSYEWQPGRRSS